MKYDVSQAIPVIRVKITNNMAQVWDLSLIDKYA
jgi:hypothetical protein